jgi:ribonuclease Z
MAPKPTRALSQTGGVVDVVILGSGTPLPEAQRGGSALAVVADGEWLLVDCGRAATQRAIDAGLDLASVTAVAITHHHSDHLSDLATFATTRWTSGATSPLTVVAPSGPAARFAAQCLTVYDDQSFYAQASDAAGSRPAIDVHAFTGSQEVTPVYASDGWRLSSVLVDHHPVEPAVGYLVEHGGARVAISGDTAVCDGMRGLARDVDVLVHEALLSSRVPSALLEWNAAARAVGELAAETLPHTLVLTHLIPTPTSAEDERAYVDEVRAGGFDGSTIVARDLLRISINQNEAGPRGSPSPDDGRRTR